VLAPDAGWQLLFRMQEVLAEQPAVARAVRRLSLHDQLSLTLQLLRTVDWPATPTAEPLPPNVVRFRPREAR
jgi:hypothetical protein